MAGDLSLYSPTAVQIKRAGKVGKDLYQLTMAAFAKTIPDEERQKLMYYLTSNGRKSYVPEKFPKVLYDGMPWVPYGIGNIGLSGIWAYRNYINPGSDWDERISSKKTKPAKGNGEYNNDIPPNDIPDDTPNDSPPNDAPEN